MPGLTLTTNLDLDPWTDLAGHVDESRFGTIERVGLLPNGTSTGRPTIVVLVRLPDGSIVTGETTWALWTSATRALAASPVAEFDRMENPA